MGSWEVEGLEHGGPGNSGIALADCPNTSLASYTVATSEEWAGGGVHYSRAWARTMPPAEPATPCSEGILASEGTGLKASCVDDRGILA